MMVLLVNKRARFIALMIAAACLGVIVGNQNSSAATHGWKWDPFIDIKVKDNSTGYGSNISGAIDDYNDWDTALPEIETCTGSSCTLNFVIGNYGDNDYYGWAQPFHLSTDCVQNPNYCNTSTHKVDFGYAYLNSFYGPYSSSLAQHLAAHEMGHIFGMAHESCGDDYSDDESVMSSEEGGVNCEYLPELELFDVGVLEAIY